MRRDPGLRPGVNVADGKVTHPAVAEGVGGEHVSSRRGARGRQHPKGLTPKTADKGETTQMATATAKKTSKSSRNDGRREEDVLALKNMIGGKFVAPAKGKREDVVNPGDRRGDRPRAAVDQGGRRRRRQGRQGSLRDLGRDHPGERQERLLAARRPRSRSAPTRSPTSRPPTPASRASPSTTTRSRSWSTTCATSPAPPATSRAAPPASTSRATRRWSAASRSASSARSPPGTTR